MSAIADDIPRWKPWRIPWGVIGAFIMTMGWLVLRSSVPSGGGEEGFTCDQTFSNTTGLVTAIGNAANDTTICLNDGNYGTVTLNDIARSGFVTLRSVNALGAQMSPQVGNTDFVRFQEMTLTDVHTNSCSTNIEFVDFDMVDSGPGMEFRGSGSCDDNQNLLVDGGDFRTVFIGEGDLEGALSTESDIHGIIIRNSLFGDENYGDGVQIGGGTRDGTIIGPGNIFDGTTQAFCDANGGAHCDAFQLYAGPTGGATVKQNIFRNGNTFIMAPDGSENLLVEDNIFEGCLLDEDHPIQIGENTWTMTGAVFRRNTVLCGAAGFIGDDVTAENNIFAGTNAEIYEFVVGGTSVRRYNMFSVGGNASGTNAITGTPQWLGGTFPVIPSTWAGWQLAGGSPGENAASDGGDVGTRYYGN